MRTPLLPLALLALLACGSIPMCAQSAEPDTVLKDRLHQSRELYAAEDVGKSLRTRAIQKSGDVSREIPEEMQNYYSCIVCPPQDPTRDSAIELATENSDIVAVGRVISIISELSPNESFIFSNGQFVFDSVWYQANRSSHLFPNITGKEVTITFPGGRVEADGHHLDVRLSDQPPLEPGHTYLLFLKYHPALHVYDLIGTRGFDLSGTVVKTLHPNPEAEARPIMGDKPAFIAAAQASVRRAQTEPTPPSPADPPAPAQPPATPSIPLPNPDASGRYHPGPGVTPPKLIYKAEPLYSEEARRAKVSADVVVSLTVDEQGKTIDVYIVRSSAGKVAEKYHKAALSLNQAAIDAVTRYRFEPGRYQGKPVPVKFNVEVNFQIF